MIIKIIGAILIAFGAVLNIVIAIQSTLEYYKDKDEQKKFQEDRKLRQQKYL